MTDINQISTPVLRAMRDLCPKRGEGTTSVELSTGGKTVTLTVETRDRIDAELKRRRAKGR